MKKYLLIIGALSLSLSAFSQTTIPVIQAGKPWRLSYDHNENKLPVGVYLNGVKLKNFTISEITLVSTNGTNSYSFVLNMVAVDRGFHKVALTAIDTDGTESDQSVPLDFRAKPNAPFNLKIIQP